MNRERFVRTIPGVHACTTMESPCAARVFLASVSVSAVAACFAVPYVLNVSNANGSLPSSAAPSGWGFQGVSP